MVITQHPVVPPGTDLPRPGRYVIDNGHSTVGFEVRHMMLTRVRGVFHDVAGTLEIAQDITQSAVEVTIAAASIDTSNAERDEHLRSGDFVLAAVYPHITFHSRSVQLQPDGLTVDGDLTIRGVTRRVSLRARYEGSGTDPWGDERIAFTAETTIDRYDWDITWNLPLEGSGLFVSREIRILLEIEAIREESAA
jgi:polyisoprenoid-binding protein YceI